MEANKSIQLQRRATFSDVRNHVQTTVTGNNPTRSGNFLNDQHAVIMERFQLRQLQPEHDGAMSSRQSARPIREKGRQELNAPTTISTLNNDSHVLTQQLASLKSTFQVDVRHVIRAFTEFLNPLLSPLSPFGWFSIARHSIAMAVLVVYLIWLPFRHAYAGCIVAEWVNSLDTFVEMVFLADWLLTFNTAIIDGKGDLVTSRWEISRHYLTGWCIPDTLSFFTFHEIIVGYSGFPASYCLAIGLFSLAGRMARVFYFTKLPWFLRAMPNKSKTQVAAVYYSRYSDLPRIVSIVSLSLLVAHYVACIWTMLGNPETDTHSCAESYSLMLFEALQLLLGQGLEAESTSQRVFGPFVIITGSVFLALEFGDVAVLVSSFNADSTEYMSKMASVMAIMDRNNLPLLLQDRILQYYEYLWKEYKSLDGKIMQQLSSELTHTLKVEVVLAKCAKLIMRVPLCKDCSSDFEKQLMLRVRMSVYLPDDFVIRCGELGDEFYMINRGSCELVTGLDDPDRTIHTRRRNSPSPLLHQPRSTVLESGDSFGEMALIMNYFHSADVHSISYVEMCILRREDFQDLLAQHPKDRKLVLSNLVNSFMRKNVLHQNPCPLLEMVRRLFEDDEMSPDQAAALLLQAMDDDVQDESVKFGLDSDFKLRPNECQLSAEATATNTNEEGLGPAPQGHNRLVALEQRLAHMEQTQAQMTELLCSISLELEAYRLAI